eukprot:GEZU01008890.1.p1 GENE.GEZU01008890.1~~GEZU01008890.1.p1  ORF type:complete len:262 (-),score=22.00 GEZU01008890.1:172-957(-)
MSRSSLLICIFIFIVILGTSGIVQGALPAAYTLPPLPYDYNALEPYIDEATMRVHHTGHHAAYTNNLNAALASIRSDPELLAKCNIDGGEEMDTVAELLQLCVAKPDVLPPALATTIRNNGGGFLNHAIFWSLMHPTNKPGMEPRTAETSFGAYGSLLRAIISTFNSMENFRKEFDSKGSSLTDLALRHPSNIATNLIATSSLTPPSLPQRPLCLAVDGCGLSIAHRRASSRLYRYPIRTPPRSMAICLSLASMFGSMRIT